MKQFASLLSIKIRNRLAGLVATTLAFCLCANTSIASPCNRYEADKAQHFADIAGKRVVEKYGGGRNVRVDVLECDLNTYSNAFRLEVAVRWTGMALSENRYLSEGRLQFQEDGSRSQYSESYSNQTLRDWKAMVGVVAALIALGSLTEEGNQ